ncbi:MAG: hypothetical protein QG656_245 [Candidatus Hydrogenedentes bacterium]|nr:hypothetical protein [Candidatus Hydrogenedentota bacterium]
MTSRTGYWLTFIAMAAVVAGYVHHRNLLQQYQDYLDNETEIRQMEQQQTQLLEQIDEAQERVQYLGSDPLEIEAAVRRNTRFVREGETIYRIEPLPRDMQPGDVPAPKP